MPRGSVLHQHDWNANATRSPSWKRPVPRGYRSPSDPAERVAARSAATSARFARFSRRSARRASLSLPGCRTARCFARSALVTRCAARSIERAYRLLARSARRARRQATNLAVSGHANQATAAAPARSSAPRLPASTPYQAPATTAGSVARCRSQVPYFNVRARTCCGCCPDRQRQGRLPRILRSVLDVPHQEDGARRTELQAVVEPGGG